MTPWPQPDPPGTPLDAAGQAAAYENLSVELLAANLTVPRRKTAAVVGVVGGTQLGKSWNG